jgi:hypothetical protein
MLLSAGRCVGKRAASQDVAVIAAIGAEPAAAAARESPAGLLLASASSKAPILLLVFASLP